MKYLRRVLTIGITMLAIVSIAALLSKIINVIGINGGIITSYQTRCEKRELLVSYEDIAPDSTIAMGAQDDTGDKLSAQRMLQNILECTMMINIAIVFILLSIFLFRVLPKEKNLRAELTKLKRETKYDDENIRTEKIKDKEKEIGANEGVIAIILVLVVVLSVSTGILNIISHFAYKPMIYLYPKEDNTKICVELGKPNALTTTYPKYIDNWNVYADRDGTLRIDGSDREYYGLYWEGNVYGSEAFEDGFCVKGENTASFLEEKLKILGLNDREAEEFIVYWLPKLEANKYNLIRFKSIDEINKMMPLEVNPKPDTVIRIIMSYKGINHEKRIQEQQLEKAYRNGFTLVEWGGVEY